MRRLAMTLTLFEMFGIPLQGHDFLKRKRCLNESFLHIITRHFEPLEHTFRDQFHQFQNPF